MPEVRKKNSSSPYLFYVVIILAFLAAGALLLPVYRDYRKRQSELAELKLELAKRRKECAELNNQVGALQSSPEAIEKVAREKFGYSKEGETIYKFSAPVKD